MEYKIDNNYNFYGIIKDVYYLQDYSLCVCIELLNENILAEFSTKNKTIKNIFYGRDGRRDITSFNAKVIGISDYQDKKLLEVKTITDIDIY